MHRPGSRQFQLPTRSAIRVVLAIVVMANPVTLAPLRIGKAAAESGSVPLVAVPKAECQRGDPIETGLQGQVPMADRLNGRASKGYACNLTLVGEFRSRSFANFDTYRNCAYYSDNPGLFVNTGTVVLDVSDPAHPVKTDYLTARAMLNAGESLRVNAKRGLLVADHYGADYAGTAESFAEGWGPKPAGPQGSSDPRIRTGSPGEGYQLQYGGSSPWLAVYDVSADCRHPKLLADVAMPHGRGHEGWFAPDGLTYYTSSVFTGVFTGRVTAIDLTDPADPRELATWPYAVHGGSASEDGTRAYMAALSLPNAVLVVDTSDVGPGRANAGRIISTFPMYHSRFHQGTFPLDYGGHPYLLDFGETTSDAPARCSDRFDTNFDAPRMIDIADERHPVMVSKFMTEVNDPANCAKVAHDNTVWTMAADQGDPFWLGLSIYFVYDDHYCTPDRVRDPTILACVNFLSGLRVYDIRDPRKPKEIAYFNTGTLSPTDPTVEGALARPVIRRDLGQIWWATINTGFHVAQFAPGVWPFPDSDPCPGAYDYFQAQYDLGYEACRASR